MRSIVTAALLTALSAPPAMAEAGNPVIGRQQFARCTTCHSAERGAPRKLGPNLAGIIGRPAGTLNGFPTYSNAMKQSRITWNPETLNAFLADPTKRVPGTTMRLGKIDDPVIRANIIAYLRTRQ